MTFLNALNSCPLVRKKCLCANHSKFTNKYFRKVAMQEQN